MAVLVFDQDAYKQLERGVSKCVLFVEDAESTHVIKAGTGVPWNGISKVSDSPEGGDVTDIYADNILFGQLQAIEKYKGNIEAYMWPDEFNACEGLEADTTAGIYYAQQTRKKFHLCYRTEYEKMDGTKSYKLHFLYNLLAAPSSKDYETINDGADAITFSWDINSTPISASSMLPAGKAAKGVSHIIVDAGVLAAAKLTALEKIIYGGTSAQEISYMPSPLEISSITG